MYNIYTFCIEVENMDTHRNVKILIIDDKEKLCRILKKDFEHMACKAEYALNTYETREKMKIYSPDVIILDLRLGNESGLNLLKELKTTHQHIPVIMVTGYGTIENAVEAVKLGAYDYIQKPVNFNEIHQRVLNAASHKHLRDENIELKGQLKLDNNILITQNQNMLDMLEKLRKLSERNFPILITGESGTGKELIADFIHHHSTRKLKKIYKVNCAALPENLLDNELFGHEKGAYTGADKIFKGIFERANEATLFLDEIGDMPLEIQAKILRTLQNNEIRRLGGKSIIHVDVRVIGATNKDIHEMVNKGQFREDLFYRLNLAMIEVPSLRERREDILLLVDFFLRELSETLGNHLKSLSNEVLKIIKNYSWPGNIRELRNVIHYMEAISDSDIITLQDLPPNLLQTSVQEENKFTKKPGDSMEEKLIRETLKSCRYNKKKTAEFLKISRKTLYNKLEKYGIQL